jgi:hypothetical protein
MKATPYFLASMALVIASCSPQAKLRRAQRLIQQAENSGLVWKSDTVFQEIKVVVPETHFDTVLRQVNFRDTIVVTRDKVVTRVKINTVSRDVFVETKCPEKIVIKKVPYTVTREIQVGDRFWTDFKEAVIWLVIGFAACFVLKTLRVI